MKKLALLLTLVAGFAHAVMLAWMSYATIVISKMSQYVSK
ncbi:hypothetical protein IANJMKHF_00222 [Klebsiella phage CPRSA]|nr:hypothetical protein IANJMKHF_00222 [Klebsiella phage CPRSA]